MKPKLNCCLDILEADAVDIEATIRDIRACDTSATPEQMKRLREAKRRLYDSVIELRVLIGDAPDRIREAIGA